MAMNGHTTPDTVWGTAFEALSPEPKRARTRWSDDENKQLMIMLHNGRSLKEMAKKLGRTEGSISYRLRTYTELRKHAVRPRVISPPSVEPVEFGARRMLLALTVFQMVVLIAFAVFVGVSGR